MFLALSVLLHMIPTTTINVRKQKSPEHTSVTHYFQQALILLGKKSSLPVLAAREKETKKDNTERDRGRETAEHTETHQETRQERVMERENEILSEKSLQREKGAGPYLFCVGKAKATSRDFFFF